MWGIDHFDLRRKVFTQKSGAFRNNNNNNNNKDTNHNNNNDNDNNNNNTCNAHFYIT